MVLVSHMRMDTCRRCVCVCNVCVMQSQQELDYGGAVPASANTHKAVYHICTKRLPYVQHACPSTVENSIKCRKWPENLIFITNKSGLGCLAIMQIILWNDKFLKREASHLVKTLTIVKCIISAVWLIALCLSRPSRIRKTWHQVMWRFILLWGILFQDSYKLKKKIYLL